MDWLPHVVIKAEHDACVKTATTALRTLHVGFPDQKATVHLISQSQPIIKYVKELCVAKGHKLIQYGGSVNPKNVSSILNIENVNGVLVGSASLDSEKISRIMNYSMLGVWLGM